MYDMTTGKAIKIHLVFLYKIPSSNDNISYNLVSVISHDGDSLDCEHYVSDVFDTTTEIWWKFDDENITQTSDSPIWVYIRETHIKKQRKIK